MKTEVSFEGICTGDGECFCWEVTEEVYKSIIGEEAFENEMRFRKELEEDGVEYKKPFRIYPADLLEKIGVCRERTIPLKFTLSVEQC